MEVRRLKGSAPPPPSPARFPGGGAPRWGFWAFDLRVAAHVATLKRIPSPRAASLQMPIEKFATKYQKYRKTSLRLYFTELLK